MIFLNYQTAFIVPILDMDCRKEVLTPEKGIRCHLREQAKAAQESKNKEILFNLRHAQLPNFIEPIVGVFKKRFHILDK